jgi:hypothetical protein
MKLGLSGLVAAGLGIWLLIADTGPAGAGALIVGVLLLLLTAASIWSWVKGE